MKPTPLSTIAASRTIHGAAYAVLLLACATARAATAVDLYQDMASGKDGDLLTPAIMNASSHPDVSKWYITGGGPWFVSDRHVGKTPGPVTVGAATYDGTNAAHAWMLNTSNAAHYVAICLDRHMQNPAVTLAFYYTTELTVRNYHIFDTISIYSPNGHFSCMQTGNGDGKGPYLDAHSCDATGKSTYSLSTKIESGKTYWINLNYNAAATNAEGTLGTASLAIFDPDRAFAQVGPTRVAVSKPAMGACLFWIGRADGHGDQTNDFSQSWFSHNMIDYTHAAFPLLPVDGTNAVASSATTMK